MFQIPPIPLYVCCGQCGAAVARELADQHVCDPDRRLDYQLVKLAPGIRAFERDLAAWLATPAGRFELFYAARERRAAGAVA